jgi:hypothetical protein
MMEDLSVVRHVFVSDTNTILTHVIRFIFQIITSVDVSVSCLVLSQSFIIMYQLISLVLMYNGLWQVHSTNS